jgi:PAT family beta-lactamase induction signal transducer AmpG
MPRRDKTKPFVFFFLVLPYGISSGFVSITLPFVLTRAGFSVAIAASIVAIGISANLWRFLWGPIADLTLTARRWYLIGFSAAALTLFPLGLFPLNPDTVGMLMAIVFIS